MKSERKQSTNSDEAIIIHSGTDRIGGIVIQILAGDSSLYIDMGARMDQSSHFFGTSLPPYLDGITSMLGAGIIPALPIYNHALPQYPDSLGDVTKLMERSDYFSPSDVNLVRQAMLFQYNHPTKVAGIMTTHYHWDHIGSIPLIDLDIPMIASPMSLQVIDAMQSHWGAHWLKEVLYSRRRDLPPIKGNKLQQTNRPLIEAVSGQVLTLGNFSTITHPVSHSAIDAQGIEIIFPSGRRVINSGDIRMGANTRDFLHYLDTNPASDIFFFDATNANQYSKKPTTTEAQLVEYFSDKFESEDTFFIMTPQRQYERWFNVIEEAKAHEKQVYVPLVVAHYIQALQPYLGLHPHIPDINDVIVYLFANKSGTYKASDYPKSMRGVIFDADDDSAQIKSVPIVDIVAGSVILMTDVNQLRRFANMAPADAQYIHSASTAYDQQGSINIGIIKHWLKQLGMEFQLAHASGHASRTELIEILSHVRSPVIIPIHTEDPMAAKALVEQATTHHPFIPTHLQRGLPYDLSGKIMKI